MDQPHPRSPASKQAIPVVLLAPDPAEVNHIRQAMAASGRKVELVAIDTPERARALLLQSDDSPADSMPALIVLNYCEAAAGGEFLSILKGEPHLRVIPVVALVATGNTQQIRCIYDHHVNCCIVKPTGMRDLCEALVAALDFWLDIAITIRKAQRSAAGY